MRSLPYSRTRLVVAAVAAGLTVALSAACHTDPYATGAAGDPPPTADGDLVVIGPVDGDTVTTPFEVAVGAAVELGPAEEGLHHIEIWFGDQREETLTRHFADTATVEEAPEGETTMWVQLADAGQKPIGAPITLAITVEPAGDQDDPEGEEDTDGGEPTGDPTPTDEPTGDGYDY